MTNRLDSNQAYIGDSTIAAYSETNLRYPGNLGGIIVQDGITYQLVKVDTSTTTVIAGTPVVWQDIDSYEVTADISDAEDGSGINLPAGVALGSVTAADHAFIIVNGKYSAVLTNGDDDITAGAALVVDADGVVDSVALGTAPTHQPLGYATAADVDGSNTVAAYICPPHNGW